MSFSWNWTWRNYVTELQVCMEFMIITLPWKRSGSIELRHFELKLRCQQLDSSSSIHLTIHPPIHPFIHSSIHPFWRTFSLISNYDTWPISIGTRRHHIPRVTGSARALRCLEGVTLIMTSIPTLGRSASSHIKGEQRRFGQRLTLYN